MSLNQLVGALYKFVREETKSPKEGAPSKLGYEFEDKASRMIHELVQGHGVSKRPPRSELEYPAFSGIKHPFDNIFVHEKVIYPIECKATTHQIEHLYAFNAKILDHALGLKIHSVPLRMRGIFLSTGQLGRSARVFAFAYGIIPIDPVMPPIAYMVESIKDDDGLRQRLQELDDRTTAYAPDVLDSKEKRNAAKLEERYTHFYRAWKAKGYD